MDLPASLDFPSARPLTESGTEAASRSLKIVIVTRGAFELDGATRTAFVVGPRTTPVAVRYLNAPDCHEWVVPPWMATALFDARGDALAGLVLELADLPRSPFRDALLRGDPDPTETARDALANWSAGRGRADGRLAARAWAEIEASPERSVADLSKLLDVGERRLRQAVRREIGLPVTAVRRLVRHERAMRALAAVPVSLADVALAAGYTDQSHMTRDFTALGGIAPARLRAALA